MPISFSGGNYPDAGAAYALMPSKSYSQARADKQADMSYMMALGDMQRQQLVEKQAFDTKVKQTFSQLKALPIQQPDQERVNLYVDQLRGELQKKILNKYDGDVRKYMMYEGDSDLQDYTEKILNNDVTQKALNHKYAFGVYSKDVADGKDYSMPVSYKLIDGTEVKDVPFAQALSDFNNFKTAELPYNGSFKMPKGAMEFYTANYHPDPQKRYGEKYKDSMGKEYLSAPQVTPQEYFDYLTNNKENPITAEQAKVLVTQLYPSIAPSLKWKTDDVFKYNLDKQKVASDNWYKNQMVGQGNQKIAIAKQSNAIKAAALAGAGSSSGQSFTEVFDKMPWETSTNGLQIKSTIGKGDNMLAAAGVKVGGPVSKVISVKNTNISKDFSNVGSTLVSVDESNVIKLPNGKMVFKGKVSMKEKDAEKKGSCTDVSNIMSNSCMQTQ